MAMLNKNQVYRNLLYIRNPKVRKKQSKFKFLWLKNPIFYLFIILLITPMLSAGLVKDYTVEGKYGKITLSDCSILGCWLSKTKSAEYTLNLVKDSIIDSKAEGIVTIYDKRVLFKGTEFLDFSGKLVSLRNVQYYILENESYEVPINPMYKLVCNPEIDNKTMQIGESCYREFVEYGGKEIRYRQVWKPYNYEEKPAGTYSWKLEASKNNYNQRIDFILKLTDDIKTNEWAWWNNTWNKRKEINITGGLSTLNNFTVLVNITYDSDMMANFSDIRFVNGSCTETQTQELKYEIDLKDDSDFALVWIKIPNLGSGVNSICMYYNNSNAANGEDSLNTWDQYYKGVFHLSEGTGTTTKDSTGNGDGTLGAGVSWNLTSKLIGNAVKMGGDATNYINLTTNTAVKFQHPQVTIEALGVSATSGTYKGIVGNDNPATEWYFARGPTGNIRYANDVNGNSLVINSVIKETFYTSMSYASGDLHIKFNDNESIHNEANTYGPVTTTVYIGAAFGVGGQTGTWEGELDEIRISNTSRSQSWINRSMDNWNKTLYSFGDEETIVKLTLTLNQPSNNYKSISSQVTFNCSATDESAVLNVTLSINGVNNYTVTNASANQNLSLQTTLNLADGNYYWNCRASDDSYNEELSLTRYFSVDTTLPVINITYPIGNIGYKTINENLTFNWTVSDNNLTSCWFNYNQTNNITIPCTQNYSSILLSSKTNLTIWANDSSGNIGNFTRSWSYSILEISQSFNASVYETDVQTFILNMSASSITSSYFWYNGTSYSVSPISDGSNHLFKKSLTIGSVTNNISNYFVWTINGVNTTLKNQNVSTISFGLCNSTLIIPYLNFTFKNESHDDYMSAYIPTANFDYWLGDGSVKKNYIFINNSINPSYAFCFYPSSLAINLDYSLQYQSSEMPQRTYTKAETLTNSTTNRILFLLGSSDGIFDTTQVLSSSGQTLSGVDVVVSRLIGGVETTVAQGITGDDGSVSFFLNPDYSHTFVFSKAGYNQLTQSFTPSSAGHTVTMVSSSSVSNTSDYSKGINILIYPQDILLDNNTVYQFNYTLVSNTWIVSSFGFDLKNESGYTLNTTSATANGGFLSQYLNTQNMSWIKMDYWYVINGTYVNSSRTWNIYNDEVDNEWSLKIFFTDLKNYTSQGIFGLDSFGLSIIVFIFIFVFTGIMTYKFGFANPGTISLIVAILVLALNSFGVMGTLAGATFGNLLTVVIILIAFGMGVREWAR